MHTISQFIQAKVILPRLRQHEVLVVYDPEGRYRELCLALSGEKIQVVDASESSLDARREALNAFNRLGEPNSGLEGLLVYVPAPAPLNDEDKQRDPFALYGACGAVFPDPTNDGDEYLSLCLKAKPDHATEIRRVFSQDPDPSFAVIDAIGDQGGRWPTLQTLLGVESARELLLALLAPDDKQQQGLDSKGNWLAEAKTLLNSTLGLHLTTKLKGWAPVADELWRYVLFSEFAFDLPGGLPSSLENVPRAPSEAQTLVFDLCEHLRNHLPTRSIYIERAETIERDLRLAQHCRGIDDFGQRDTFPFEEQAGFRRAVAALRVDDMDLLRSVLERHARSVWTERGENTARWGLVQATASLVQAAQDAARELPRHASSPESLAHFYTTSLRDVDRCQREFEQAAADLLDDDEALAALKTQARKTYTRLSNDVQQVFLKHVEKSGWPLSDLPSNRDSFDRLVAPALKESGRRVAVLLIDAMRYELGVELSKQLGDLGKVTIQAACAQLPTVTPVGMASLLPGAASALQMDAPKGKLTVTWNGQPLTTVKQRMNVLQTRYGQRFAHLSLKQFVKSRQKPDPAVELLVLRSNEMDNDFESNPDTALSLISRTFQTVSAALHRLRQLGFHEAFLLTDHGFYLNGAPDVADVCNRPSGNWLNVHDRLLLGDGTGDAANLVLPAERLGIPGTFSQVAIPRALVAYRAGQTYFHGGLSLQEAIVPVIHVLIRPTESPKTKSPEITLSYKQGAEKITTRLPVIEVMAGLQPELFASGDVELILEAHDESGNVVGEAKPGGVVNPTDRVIRLKPGERVQVILKMDLAFEGKFIVKALDPVTMAAVGEPLELETDYTV